MKTVFSDTPHASAISVTRTASKPRSMNICVAMSDSCWRIRRFLRSRSPSASAASVPGARGTVQSTVRVFMPPSIVQCQYFFCYYKFSATEE